MTVDYSRVKLGKLAPRHDDRTLKLHNYIDLAALPPAPTSTNRVQPFAARFPMFMNDTLGDCTCAAVGHMQQFWGDLSGAKEQFTDTDIELLYEKVGGYVPGNPSTDNGADELTVLNYWRKFGIKSGTGQKKIFGYASVNPSHVEMVKVGSWLFEGLYIGVALPVTAQTQPVWDVVPNGGADAEPGSWGGHAVPVVDYNASTLTIVTWGALKEMTWAFWNKYIDEAYAVLSTDAVKASGVTAEGFKLAQLTADIKGLS